MSKSKKNIRFNCPQCQVTYKAKSKFIGYKVSCKECQFKFKIPDKIYAEYKFRLYKLFKSIIKPEFLDSFISEAEARFKKNKWQLNGITLKELKCYFDNEFYIQEGMKPREFIENLEDKIEITINSNQSITRFVGKIFLVLGIIWIKLIDEEFNLTETQTNRIYKILQYFVEIDDIVPDTAVGGYLDDLYISTFTFMHIRDDKKKLILDILKRELER